MYRSSPSPEPVRSSADADHTSAGRHRPQYVARPPPPLKIFEHGCSIRRQRTPTRVCWRRTPVICPSRPLWHGVLPPLARL
jgi:hypothetical protein